ncbi:helix-turn-helix transcriptional regulator [Staphylococcus pseudintermedius]|nr:helix-turn-helix transcriptional regulator [Staphylococcus pseudintermedius]
MADITLNFLKPLFDRWEKGTTSPSISHASALADFFDISLDELSGRHNLEIEQQDTMAAHFDKDGLTPEEIDEVNRFIEWVRNRDK